MSRVGAGLITGVQDWSWTDVRQGPFEVWSEEGEVVIYHGTKETAHRREVFTPEQADSLASMLRTAARRARSGT